MKTQPLNPQRLRHVPQQFSWVDHRLVREGHLQRCDHAALSLYLFYLTVADVLGMSYYSDLRLCTALSMTQIQLSAARQCLVTQDLIAYVRPFVQVLSMGGPTIGEGSPKNQSRINGQTMTPLNAQTRRVAPVTNPEKRLAFLEKLRSQLGGKHD